MKKFSFKSIEKPVFPVELPDGQELNLLPCPWGCLVKLRAMSDGDFAGVIGVLADILSANTDGKKITAEYVERTFAADDLSDFFVAYGEYIAQATNQKN